MPDGGTKGQNNNVIQLGSDVENYFLYKSKEHVGGDWREEVSWNRKTG